MTIFLVVLAFAAGFAACCFWPDWAKPLPTAPGRSTAVPEGRFVVVTPFGTQQFESSSDASAAIAGCRAANTPYRYLMDGKVVKDA